ncbi:ABC transporter ATP-binding protein [Verminephrobacter eiseniae]|uniref:ABC transporter ATP-binding protein n=1 Tax=Verminephrobacter eiseniae TaxID=364317 RepID=UPI00223703F1|nr:ABC transporter ATP-binding protein [Verminephrobacter eiseniae]MCW5235927.1 ABC transporter ATP-binding protein [Verminephrobacter eiseniae]
MLEVRNIESGYGRTKVLHGVSLSVPDGALVAVLGGNGSGKSTTLKTLAGLVRPSAGEITLAGQRIDQVPACRMASSGLVLVPQGKEVFAAMSVEENILMGGYHRRREKARLRDDLQEVYALFPRLALRRKALAGLLSGGERQMLSIGRALLAKPRMLLLDEPSSALAPKVVGEIAEVIRGLRGRGIAILLVEQNVAMALELADELHILREGRVAHSCVNGPGVDLASLQEFYLGKGTR